MFEEKSKEVFEEKSTEVFEEKSKEASEEKGTDMSDEDTKCWEKLHRAEYSFFHTLQLIY